jgi:hypothetical protein
MYYTEIHTQVFARRPIKTYIIIFFLFQSNTIDSQAIHYNFITSRTCSEGDNYRFRISVWILLLLL